jgi:YHS domain-containing protein
LIDGISNGSEDLNLWLPSGFRIGYVGKQYDPKDDKKVIESDSTLSSWYRGKRYGFAQQSVYVPLLEKYCQKFERNETIPLTDSNFKLHQDGGGSISIKVLTKDENQNIVGLSGSKRANWSGYKIDIDYSSAHTYLLSYQLRVNQGTLYTIGGHNASFYTEMEVRHGDKIYKTSSSYVDFGNNGLAVGQTIEVFVRYNKFVPETTDWSPYIFI